MDIQFKSAFDIVRFALCYSSQQYGETLLAKRLRSPSVGTGMGLVGLDGAGQVGQIRRELSQLPELHQAVLIARAAPHPSPCDCGRSCCARYKKNAEWEAAISWLTDASAAYLSGFSHYQVRRAIIEKIFNVKRNLVDIAGKCGAHRNTISAQHTTVRRWLKGDAITHQPGVEQTAWTVLEQRFIELGLIEMALAA